MRSLTGVCMWIGSQRDVVTVYLAPECGRRSGKSEQKTVLIVTEASKLIEPPCG
jgi:hypothetical protein